MQIRSLARQRTYFGLWGQIGLLETLQHLSLRHMEKGGIYNFYRSPKSCDIGNEQILQLRPKTPYSWLHKPPTLLDRRPFVEENHKLNSISRNNWAQGMSLWDPPLGVLKYKIGKIIKIPKTSYKNSRKIFSLCHFCVNRKPELKFCMFSKLSAGPRF